MSDVDRLVDLTKRWNSFEDVPRSQQLECREIGKRINNHGGLVAMQEAYQTARTHNRYAYVIQAYWYGIGDWRW